MVAARLQASQGQAADMSVVDSGGTVGSLRAELEQDGLSIWSHQARSLAEGYMYVRGVTLFLFVTGTRVERLAFRVSDDGAVVIGYRGLGEGHVPGALDVPGAAASREPGPEMMLFRCFDERVLGEEYLTLSLEGVDEDDVMTEEPFSFEGLAAQQQALGMDGWLESVSGEGMARAFSDGATRAAATFAGILSNRPLNVFVSYSAHRGGAAALMTWQNVPVMAVAGHA